MFKYKVNFWDAVNQEPATECGLVDEKQYEVAAKEISKYYGENNIEDMQLEILENLLTDQDIQELLNSGE